MEENKTPRKPPVILGKGLSTELKTRLERTDKRGKQVEKPKFSNYAPLSYVIEEDYLREDTYLELKYTSNEFVAPMSAAGGLVEMAYSAFITCGVHASILKKKVSWTCGAGFAAVPRKNWFETNETPVSDAQKGALAEFMKKQNPEGENASDVYNKAVWDFWNYGSSFIEMVRSKSGGAKVFVQRSIPFHKCRVAKKKEGEYEPTHVGISEYWIEGYYLNPPDLRKVALYPNWSKDPDNANVERCVYQIKNYAPMCDYYGAADHIAGFIHFDNDYQGQKYNNSQFKNGFCPSSINTFYGDYTTQEGVDLIENIESHWTGTGNNSRMFTTVLARKEDAPDIQVLDSGNKEGAFLELSEITTNGAIIAHRFTPLLAGVEIAGKLGGGREYREQFEVMFGNVIRPTQIEVNRWFNIAIGLWEEWTGNKCNCDIDIINKRPLSFATDIPISLVLAESEQRKEIGYTDPKPLK